MMVKYSLDFFFIFDSSRNKCFFPLLFQVYQEFNRVVGKNLKQEFYGSLDRHCPQLIQMFRSKRGLAGQILSDLLQQAKVCTFKLMPLFA